MTTAKLSPEAQELLNAAYERAELAEAALRSRDEAVSELLPKVREILRWKRATVCLEAHEKAYQEMEAAAERLEKIVGTEGKR